MNGLNQLISELQEKEAKAYLGGGAAKIKQQHEQGKLTARERIAKLLDADTEQIEIGLFAGEGMYQEYGGCPSGGVVVVMGYVSGRLCVVVANDATVKAGAWFPMTAKKNLRAQEIAMENKIPIIYLVDSAGIFLPLQNEVFADKEHFGRIFRNNAHMSAMGIVQIAVIMGSCVAGGAYLPIMSDEAMIVDKTGSIFLAGSYLVKAAIGEDIDNEALGGATMHCEVSGVTDNKYPDDSAALQAIRNIISTLGKPEDAGFNRITPHKPLFESSKIAEIFPEEATKPYDMLDLVKCLVDNSEIEEYKPEYGKTILCGVARIDGWAVGIVANQRKIVKSGKKEMQMGGVIYSDSADKAARFIMNCNQRKIPLVFLQDVTGFMVGSRSEQGGIIKDGAKLVNAMANSVVPKFTIVIGNSYGAGNYAMCGKAFDPRLMLTWPTGKIAVMSGASAAKTLLSIKISSLKAQGKTITKEDEAQMLQEIAQKYESETTPYYAASQLWVDAIIKPEDTRKAISLGIEAANHAPINQRFNVGVIQT